MKSCAIAVAVAVLLSVGVLGAVCREDSLIRMRLGGISNCKGHGNSGEILSLARFAVEEHNKKENTLLEFARVLRAKEQVVAGKMYYLTVEAIDSGIKKIYEAKVWVKPWMNFKQLQEFKHAKDEIGFTLSDLRIKHGN